MAPVGHSPSSSNRKLPAAHQKQNGPPTKWGIICAGKICHDFVLTLKANSSPDQHHVVAIGARHLKDARAFATKHGIPKAYGTYLEVFEDKNVQVVYIGALNPDHARLAKQALNHGKAVLLEKPATMCEASTREVINLAREKGLFFMEGIWSRFLPTWVDLTHLLIDKVIGDVIHVEVTFGRQDMASHERITKRELGGGVLYDVGVYGLAAILTAFDDQMPINVAAVGHLNSEGVDTAVVAPMTFARGGTASMTLSCVVKLPNELIISGTHGMIKVKDPFHSPSTLEVKGHTHSHPLPCAPYFKKYSYSNSAGLIYEAHEVRRALLASETESPRVSHEFSLKIASISDTLRNTLGYTKFVERK